jgi:hypothetical protein
MAERVQAVEAALHRNGTATPAELAGQFKRPNPPTLRKFSKRW